MRHRTAAPLVVLLLGAALAACGGSAGQNGAAGSTPGAAATEAPATESAETEAPATEAAAGEATEAPAASAAAGGDAQTQITESGVLMPKQVGAVTYLASENTGAELAMWLPFKSDDLDSVLDAQGKTRDNALLVKGVASDLAWPSVNAIRIDGGDAQALATQVQQNSLAGQTWATADMGGKQVSKASSDSGTSVMYVKGDTLYLLFAQDASTLEPVLAVLP